MGIAFRLDEMAKAVGMTDEELLKEIFPGKHPRPELSVLIDWYKEETNPAIKGSILRQILPHFLVLRG